VRQGQYTPDRRAQQRQTDRAQSGSEKKQKRSVFKARLILTVAVFVVLGGLIGIGSLADLKSRHHQYTAGNISQFHMVLLMLSDYAAPAETGVRYLQFKPNRVRMQARTNN
jgi:hypothetical protein